MRSARALSGENPRAARDGKVIAPVDGARAGGRRQEVGTTGPIITKAANVPLRGVKNHDPHATLNLGGTHVERRMDTQLARACMGTYASRVPRKSGETAVATLTAIGTPIQRAPRVVRASKSAAHQCKSAQKHWHRAGTTGRPLSRTITPLIDAGPEGRRRVQCRR